MTLFNLMLVSACFSLFFMIISGCERTETDSVDTPEELMTIKFWNGNRSEARQDYERLVFVALLEATEDQYGAWEIEENLDEYPGAEESQVFTEKGQDVFVTIAGNQKFSEDDMIVVPHLLTKNLMGYRVPVIRQDDAETFAGIRDEAQVQQLTHGIPRTWSDAVIFRENGYEVSEEGDFEDIFDRLQAGRFDYSAFGANEVLSVYENRARERENLVIDPNLLFFYPFPLVFYVSPQRPELAERIETGMRAIQESGRLDEIFDAHYGNIVEELHLSGRKLIILDNPLIPERFRDLQPELKSL
ncbi:MAG: ABC transporter substrate-binding protein [Cyclonatronaceae bacterium]